MKKLIALAACAAALGLARPVRAQEPTASHLAAAREAIAAANDSANFYRAFQMGLRQSLPALGDDSTIVLGAVSTWSQKYLRWNTLEPEFARLYTSFYTEAELRDMAAFLRSPTGRKMSQVAPQFAAGSMAIGERAAAQHSAELQQAVIEAVQNSTRKKP
jgi:hypothetical protein